MNEIIRLKEASLVSNAVNLRIIRLKRKKDTVNNSTFPAFYIKYNTKGKCDGSKDHDI